MMHVEYESDLPPERAAKVKQLQTACNMILSMLAAMQDQFGDDVVDMALAAALANAYGEDREAGMDELRERVMMFPDPMVEHLQ